MVISILTSIASFLSFAAAYYPQGFITSPPNGTHIAPGQAFNFTYNQRGDYCTSSFNYTVWLLTSSPATLLSLQSTGRFLGEYQTASSQNPNPPNPVPAQLVMPDFSKSPGGFVPGTTASDLEIWLAVVEEWGTCSLQVGLTLSIAANHLVYNATQIY